MHDLPAGRWGALQVSARVGGILRGTMRLELTRRGDYAVRAVIALARARDGAVLSTRRIAAEMSIPPRFLPQVMGDLVRARIVVAQAGRAGGYRLARPAIEISLLSVIRAAEGDDRARTCVLHGGPCNGGGHCDVHDVFTTSRDAMLAVLGRTTVGEIVAASRGDGQSDAPAAGGVGGRPGAAALESTLAAAALDA